MGNISEVKRQDTESNWIWCFWRREGGIKGDSLVSGLCGWFGVGII